MKSLETVSNNGPKNYKDFTGHVLEFAPTNSAMTSEYEIQPRTNEGCTGFAEFVDNSAGIYEMCVVTGSIRYNFLFVARSN